MVDIQSLLVLIKKHARLLYDKRIVGYYLYQLVLN